MSDRMPLDHPCIYKDRISGNNVNKADSNYHAVVWRPIGGVSPNQVQLLYSQFRKDLGDGQLRTAERGSFGIEGTGAGRHVHIALILTRRAETTVTSTRYKALLGEEAMNEACCTVNGVQVKKTALVCCQPATNKMEHYKQTTWLAYPMKEAAMNPDFTPNDYDNGSTRRLAFVFGGLVGTALKEATERFETSMKTFWHNKIVQKKTIYYNKSMHKLAREFYPTHCPDLPWSNKANRAEVLARMYLHKGRYLKYDFAANFFKEKFIIERFTNHEGEEDLFQVVVDAIQRTFDIVDGKSKPTTTASLTIKALRDELKELKRPKKFRCQNHACRKWGWNRVSTMNADNSEWWAMCSAKRDAIHAKELLEREVAELKKQLQGEPALKRRKVTAKACDHNYMCGAPGLCAQCRK